MWKIADAHCDTLWEIGVRGTAPEDCCVTAQRLRKGGVSLQTFALWAGPKGPQDDPAGKARAMLAAVDRLGVPVCRGPLPEELPEEPMGVLSIEGGEILEGSIARLDEYHQRSRVRLIALTWNNENEIGYPSAQDGPGLKPFGLHLLREMDARGIFADVSHLSEKGFWDVAEHAELPPVASHSNLRELCDVHRNLRREQARAIIERGGYIGVNLYSAFLAKDRPAVFEDVLRHIDALIGLGGEDAVGLGTDFDGIETWPEGLGTPAELPALLDALLARGYTREQVEKIAGGNYWRLLKRGEAAARIGK